MDQRSSLGRGKWWQTPETGKEGLMSLMMEVMLQNEAVRVACGALMHWGLVVLSENEGQFNRLLCNFNRLLACLLHVIYYISSSSPHYNFHYSSIYSTTYHSQPKRLFPFTKGNPNLYFSHTFTITKLPFPNPNLSSTFEPPFIFWKWPATSPELKRNPNPPKGSKSALRQLSTG